MGLSLVRETKELHSSGVSVSIVFIVAGVGQQVRAWMPGDCKGRCVHRNADNALASTYVADVDQQVLRPGRQH